MNNPNDIMELFINPYITNKSKKISDCLNDMCARGIVDVVKSIIHSKVLDVYDINTLNYACKGGRVEIIDLVIKVCRLTNSAKNVHKMWLRGLEGAYEEGHINIVKQYTKNVTMCKNMVDTYVWRTFTCNCLKNACFSGNTELIDFFINSISVLLKSLLEADLVKITNYQSGLKLNPRVLIQVNTLHVWSCLVLPSPA